MRRERGGSAGRSRRREPLRHERGRGNHHGQVRLSSADLPAIRRGGFAGSGWTPCRSTLLHIAEAAGDLLPPFIASLREDVLASEILGTDDTRVTLLLPPVISPPRDADPKAQRAFEVFSAARAADEPSVTGRMWAYRSVLTPLNVFDFTVSHHREGPDQFLIDTQFTGTLLADCYSGYQGITLRSDSRIVRAACNAHARRKFFDARDNHPLLASQFLALYQQLYDVEDRVRGLSASDRQSLRAAESQPLWDRMRELLDGAVAKQVLPKEKIAEALNYLRKQGVALRLYLTDGRVPIDNNDVEQLMKQVALGRKNWLFLGMAEWTSANNHATRVANLLNGGGANGTTKLNSTTVQDDLAAETLTGGAEIDWFFQFDADVLTDFNAGLAEIITPI